jgi:hypothetical protein
MACESAIERPVSPGSGLILLEADEHGSVPVDLELYALPELF